jgi:hypothetical protein
MRPRSTPRVLPDQTDLGFAPLSTTLVFARTKAGAAREGEECRKRDPRLAGAGAADQAAAPRGHLLPHDLEHLTARQTKLSLLDVPQHRDRRVGDSGQGIAIGAAGDVLPGRQIEPDLEGATLDLVGQLAALRLVRGGEPRGAQRFDRKRTRTVAWGRGSVHLRIMGRRWIAARPRPLPEPVSG